MIRMHWLLSAAAGIIAGAVAAACSPPFTSCELRHSCPDESAGAGGLGAGQAGAGSAGRGAPAGDGGFAEIGDRASDGGAAGELDEPACGGVWQGGVCRAPICGDGVVFSKLEQCDDANVVAGDGCSVSCNWEPIALSLGDAHTCALSAHGALKCWGDNAFGQLGLGDVKRRGDDAGEIAALPVIRLGAGHSVRAVASGHGTNCVLLDDGSIKCWGSNSYGQLGLGDAVARGNEPGQMGDALPSVALVGGAIATRISNGYLHACALANDRVQCWGSGVSGQLGQGNTLAYSRPVGVFDFGSAAGVSAAAGGAFNCELLQTGKVICWGENGDGQLCYSNEPEAASVGDRPGEMSQLLPVPFVGLTIKAVAPGAAFVCALLSDDSVRCWGRGDSGQLGTEDPDPHGTVPYSLASVHAVALGAGHLAKSISAGARHVCALLANASVKCWGNNDFGQLGVGNMTTVGAAPSTMGENLKAVALGTGRWARQVVAGEDHTCALLDNGTIKCWGRNLEGQLGLGDTLNRGTGVNQMGDALPTVPLSF